MGVKQLKVDVNDVTVGMFVSGLDRPWTQTPFSLQGFYIRDAEEIRQLKAHCRFVYVDMARGSGPLADRLKSYSREAPKRAPRVSRTSKVKIDVAPLKIRHGVYEVSTTLKTEFDRALQLHHVAEGVLAEVMRQVENDQPIPVLQVRQLASEMVDSVLRNPDAFTWLSRVRNRQQHIYSPSLRATVWAVMFGRHIGLGKKDLDTLANGVLLKDIGKTRIDGSLLKKQQRTAAEERQYEQFVEFSTIMLRQAPDIEPRVISVVKSHCERVNGSGYPQQLAGDKIPLLGRIAGIVTYYDEIIQPPGEQYPMSPSRAVAKLYECRDKEFQEELVVEFIRAIGLYPTATLVELNSGEVAVVVEQNFDRRLKPKVVIVMDAARIRLQTPAFLDLAIDDREKQALIDSGRKRLDEVEKIEIVQDLEVNSLAIDIEQVRENYLAVTTTEKKKSFFSFLRRSSRG